MRLIIFWDFYGFSRKFSFGAPKLIKKAQKAIESSWTDDLNQVAYYVFWKVLKIFEKNGLKALFNEKLVFSWKTGFLPIFFLFSGYCWVKCIEICKIIVTSMVNYIWEQNLCHFWNMHFLHVWNCSLYLSSCPIDIVFCLHE